MNETITEFKSKTKSGWIAQCRLAMDDAEKYGANTPNEMREKEKNLLREALTALGQNVNF